MKPKQIIILSFIFALLLAGVVAKQFYKPPEVVTEEFAPLDLAFEPAQAVKIEIAKKDQKLVELSKAGEKWKVVNSMNSKGDSKKIDEFLKAVREAKGELRAKDKALFNDFGIGDDEAFKISVLDGQNKPLVAILIGTKKPGFQSVFLRKSDSDKVYLSDADLFRKMGLYGEPATDSPKADYWANLALLDLNVDQVNKFESRRFKGANEIVTAGVIREVDPQDATKKRWKFIRADAPFVAEADKIKQFLTQLNTSRASKVLDPAEKDYGFNQPRLRINIGLEGGAEAVVTAGGENTETKGIYVQVSGDPLVYEVPSYSYQNLDVDDAKFFVANPLAIDPEKAEKLIVHADTKESTFAPKQKKWESLTAYLNDLKALVPTKLILDPNEQKKVQAGGRYWIEIQAEGQAPVTVDFGDSISDQNKDHVVRKRDNTLPFGISDAHYKKLFENLDRLNEPPAQPETTPVPQTSLAPQTPPVTPPAPLSPPAINQSADTSKPVPPPPAKDKKKKK